ncbi:MAG: hypothetical protein GXC78_13115 [Chitinophagaceae bacterium]|nr:hypothetical protein [Chitinophagaceae bacterium]
MNHKKILRDLLIIVLITVTACNNKKDDKIKIALSAASEEESGQVQDSLLIEMDSTMTSTKSLFPINGAAGDQELFWKQAFKACFDDGATANNTIFSKRLIYMGPSNNKYLGTIIDKKGRTRRTLTSIIPMSEIQKFSNIGEVVNNCDLTRVKKVTVDFVIGGGFLSSADANLAAAFNNADSTIITGGSWRKDDFNIDAFLDFVNESTDPNVKKYKETLLENGNKVVTLVYKVDGFSAKSFLNKDVGVELEAKLKNTIEIKMPGVDSAKSTIKFSSATKKEINISSSNSFYVFANIWVGKKL